MSFLWPFSDPLICYSALVILRGKHSNPCFKTILIDQVFFLEHFPGVLFLRSHIDKTMKYLGWWVTWGLGGWEVGVFI